MKLFVCLLISAQSYKDYAKQQRKLKFFYGYWPLAISRWPLAIGFIGTANYLPRARFAIAEAKTKSFSSLLSA